MDGGGKDASTGPKSIQSDRISNVSRVEGKLPEGLRLAGRNVPAADGMQVPLYLFRLPDGSDMKMVAVPAGDFSPPQGGTGRVDRGGSWGNPARGCRSSMRYWYAPSERNEHLGFRVLLRSVP